MMAHILLVLLWSHAEASIFEDVSRLCNHLKILDNRIFKALRQLPKYEGEYVVKDITDYNAGLNTLLDFLTDRRNATLEVEEAVELLKDGAPDYFEANIDPDKAKLHWGWLDKGLGEIYQLRAESIRAWSLLNRASRLVDLEFYTYPEGMNYTGYENPNFPPLREKMSNE